MTEEEAEDWLLEAGEAVVERKAARSYAGLTARERLIYCLWVADYGMRNAGDLASASDLHPGFMADALAAARDLGLPQVEVAFALSPADLERRYFSLFVSLVEEIKGEN